MPEPSKSDVEQLVDRCARGVASTQEGEELRAAFAELAHQLEQAEQREKEAWQMIGAMLTENGGPFRVSSRSLHLAPTAPVFTGSEDLDGSVLLALTTPESPPVEAEEEG